ncbi:uncharacterized protein LOC132724896 [Ruditapes philippinarum]|uniref:uncharacterized protein LOC132724896 n=1 Tax=Ruditapes philippinarum TaxID=129788 RepID=UPI00295C2315|nr:uncharacterized protein LOC132724896 [Ruditapes philippinarum]
MASGGTKTDVTAAIGCFVQNGDGKTVYAVVCKHVTYAANKFSVRGIPFATVTQKTKETKKTRETTPTFNHFDIDLVKVKINQVQKCKPVFRDAHGDIRKARIFKGELGSLDPVFACFNNARNEDERRTGKVLPMSEADETIRDCYSSDTHFVVKGDSFATVGHSGRVVAYYDAKSDEGFIELLGMIVHKTGSQTVCLKLHNGFKHLNEEYGFNLSLCEPENYTGDENACVETGDYINF